MNTIVQICLETYTKLLPISWIGLLIVLVVLLPLACFRRTRFFAGHGISIFSWVLGLTTWLLGAVITFSTYGWWALIIGLLLFGIGVVPIAIFAAFISLKIPAMAVSLIVMATLVWVCRFSSTALILNAGRNV